MHKIQTMGPCKVETRFAWVFIGGEYFGGYREGRALSWGAVDTRETFCMNFVFLECFSNKKSLLCRLSTAKSLCIT